jgi:hypothetical protein
VAELARRAGELLAASPVVVYCAGVWRSSVAASLLRPAGRHDVSDLLHGYAAWQAVNELSPRHALKPFTVSEREITMCRPATCRTCNKATYTGCGQHVEQVLKGVPATQRCTCSPDLRDTSRPSLLSRLLRR